MRCKNCEGKYYKGNEPSPKGRGYCASAESVGTTKRGLDGKVWVVKPYGKNGKRWMHSKKSSSVSSPRGDRQTKTPDFSLDHDIFSGKFAVFLNDKTMISEVYNDWSEARKEKKRLKDLCFMKDVSFDEDTGELFLFDMKEPDLDKMSDDKIDHYVLGQEIRCDKMITIKKIDFDEDTGELFLF